MGLAHALLFVGARCVIATLWKIDDADAATLSGEFYARIARGESRRNGDNIAQASRNDRLPYVGFNGRLTISGLGSCRAITEQINRSAVAAAF